MLTGSTFDAIDAIAEAEILPAATCKALADDLVWLRRIEHYLQVLHDRQTHALPVDRDELTALARRIGGPDSSAESLETELTERLERVHAMYEEHLSVADGST